MKIFKEVKLAVITKIFEKEDPEVLIEPFVTGTKVRVLFVFKNLRDDYQWPEILANKCDVPFLNFLLSEFDEMNRITIGVSAVARRQRIEKPENLGTVGNILMEARKKAQSENIPMMHAMTEWACEKIKLNKGES
jgi:hypothetical protein